MANNRDLLKEAIADAKSVKETAIANAKLALEEAFTPYLQDQLSAKLQEMDDEDDKDVKEEEVKEMDAPSFERKNSPAGDSLKDLAPRKVGQSTVQEDEVDEEIDLDELLAELELDEDARTDAEEEGYKDGMKDEKADLKEDERTDAEEEGYEDGMKDEKEDMEDKDDEEIDLEDMSEDDLKGFIEDVIKDMVEAGELEAGEEMEMDGEESEMDMDIEVEDEVEPMMEKEELEEDDAVSKKLKDGASLDSAPRKVGQSTVQEDEVKDALAEIEELKAELNEVNLLNAKLLYTNKIFKSKNLSEDKKVKVLKAFDKAETVKEAKVIFETLNEGVVSKAETTARPKGQASKVTAPITEAKKPIVENAAFARMQRLAGIIKEN